MSDVGGLFDNTLVLTTAAVLVPTLIFLLYLKLFKREEEELAFERGPVIEDKDDDDADGVPVMIFFGSQTGTAESFAQRLADDAKRFGFRAKCKELDEVEADPASVAEHKLAVFVMATYGDGEPTDDAATFHQFLLDAPDAEQCMAGVRFTVFGLGNRQYEHFNIMGKTIDSRMEALGGERLFELGLGDDDQVLEQDFCTWADKMWPALAEAVGTEVDANAEGGAVEAKFTLAWQDAGVAEYTRPTVPESGTVDHKHPALARVVENRELHAATSDRSCRHVDIDISHVPVEYDVGDHLGVFAENDAALVERLARRLGVDDASAVFVLEPVDGERKSPFPGPLSVRTALAQYCDITTPATHGLLKVLAHYTRDDAEQARIRAMLDSDNESGVAQYQQFIHDDYRCIVEVLEEFPSCAVPLEHMLEALPKLQPRYYSISSAPMHAPGHVTATVVWTSFTTGTGRVHNGIASTWLRSVAPGTMAPVFVRHSHFKLPTDASKPVVMIGPGTGLAPFMGFLQKRAIQHDEGVATGSMTLFFGCRRADIDYIYKDELAAYEQRGVLTNLHVAFSRAQAEKVYVQHLMKKEGAAVWEALQQGGYFYVCGDAARMAKDVWSTLIHIAQEHGGMDADAAHDFAEKLRTDGRYQADVW